ncbi:MAG: hypothetical protein SV201_01100, partial [Pseudomonadota bacterium]|nr:hypothetical protein [Pseudomonadota bacterium]
MLDLNPSSLIYICLVRAFWLTDIAIWAQPVAGFAMLVRDGYHPNIMLPNLINDVIWKTLHYQSAQIGRYFH